MTTVETVPYKGWKKNVRLSNGEVELVVTCDVGPRIIRFAFKGGQNILGELPEQMGRGGEKDWMIRGGHRLWIAPESKPWSYEPDNTPVHVRAGAGKVMVWQEPGPVTGIRKAMEISLSPSENKAVIKHILTNKNRRPALLAPWALTVMAKRGEAIIPLPEKIPHTARLTHNQSWSLWGYTDLSDPRWTIGSKYLRFRQDPRRGPNKLGLAQSEGWAGYLLGGLLFVKQFHRVENEEYPDGGVNFETFSNEQILELESLGPIVRLNPGRSTIHHETWTLRRGVAECGSENALDKRVKQCLSCPESVTRLCG